MFCTIMEDGLVTGSFTANAWTNYPSEHPIDPYGRYGPLPRGKYDLPNAYSPEFERRLPSPTNTGTPSVVRILRGTIRTGIRVHRGRISKGCITLGPGAKAQQLENELTNLVDRHLSKGGSIMTIGEVECCEDYMGRGNKC
jgi:hypothetical protein